MYRTADETRDDRTAQHNFKHHHKYNTYTDYNTKYNEELTFNTLGG